MKAFFVSKRLAVGSAIKTKTHVKKLKALGITHVINLRASNNKQVQKFSHLWLPPTNPGLVQSVLAARSEIAPGLPDPSCSISSKSIKPFRGILDWSASVRTYLDPAELHGASSADCGLPLPSQAGRPRCRVI